MSLLLVVVKFVERFTSVLWTHICIMSWRSGNPWVYQTWNVSKSLEKVYLRSLVQSQTANLAHFKSKCFLNALPNEAKLHKKHWACLYSKEANLPFVLLLAKVAVWLPTSRVTLYILICLGSYSRQTPKILLIKWINTF